MHTREDILSAANEVGIPEDMRYDACILAGIPEDAATFIVEWWPEIADAYCIPAIENNGYYNPYTFTVMTEDELSSFLDWGDITEDEYNERYGIIIRDAAFEGVLVAGE